MPPSHEQPQSNRPVAPEHIEGEALLEWHRICDELSARNLLDKTDRALITLYVETWATWNIAKQHVARFGPVIKLHNNIAGKNPYYGIMRETAAQLRTLLTDMKLTPACRRSTEGQMSDEELPL